MEINIKIREHWLSECALLIYLMVLFAHQNGGGGIDALLRYGSLLFIVAAYFMDHPPLQNQKNRGVLFLTEYSLWLIILLSYLILTALWSIQVSNVLSTVNNIFKAALVCMVVEPHLRKKEDIDQSIRYLLIALVYMVMAYLVKTPVHQWGSVRAGVVLGMSPNDWARNCALGSVVAMYFYASANKNRFLYFLLIVLFSGFSLISGSKNAILIVVFQIGLFVFLKTDHSLRFLVILASLLSIVLLLYLVTEIPYLYSILGYRFTDMMVELGLMAGTANEYGSTRERIFFIRTALEQFRSHPLLGIGCNNFSSYLASIHYQNPKYSHSGFVELLSTTGIIGFLLYYIQYLSLIARLKMKAFAHDPLFILLFVIIIRIFIFDISTIGMYTYNNYILLMIASALLYATDQKRGEL